MNYYYGKLTYKLIPQAVNKGLDLTSKKNRDILSKCEDIFIKQKNLNFEIIESSILQNQFTADVKANNKKEYDTIENFGQVCANNGMREFVENHRLFDIIKE